MLWYAQRIIYYLQGFEQHTDETDPERIKQIIERSIEDSDWIVKKVGKSSFWLNCMKTNRPRAVDTPSHQHIFFFLFQYTKK